MSRKMVKGYFVKGTFVAEGSPLDLELKRQMKGGEGPSRTDKKRESDALQAMGEDLLALSPARLQALALPDILADALAEARRLSNFEAKRRQMQYVGKLMRKLDDDTVERVRQVVKGAP
jgi:ribosome-associated protein